MKCDGTGEGRTSQESMVRKKIYKRGVRIRPTLSRLTKAELNTCGVVRSTTSDVRSNANSGNTCVSVIT